MQSPRTVTVSGSSRASSRRPAARRLSGSAPDGRLAMSEEAVRTLIGGGRRRPYDTRPFPTVILSKLRGQRPQQLEHAGGDRGEQPGIEEHRDPVVAAGLGEL